MAKSYSVRVASRYPSEAGALDRLQHLFSMGGPIGLIPWVPATLASALVAALCWLRPPGAWMVAALATAIYFLGAVTATTSERILGVQDPRNVVIDEIAGQLLTFLFVAPYDWRLALAGFALFRVFDIAKPFPANRAESLPGGWGIMSDDMIAGLYAAASLIVLHRWM